MFRMDTCTECGKTNTKRAVPHVYHNLRVVCSACLKKLEKKDLRETETASAAHVTADMMVNEDDDEPTVKQIRFAEHLGIISPRTYSKWELSEKIDEAIAEKDERIVNVVYQPPMRHHAKKSSSGCLVMVLAFLVVVALISAVIRL